MQFIARIDAINPTAYARTRNFLHGAVTRLSPYITHGVISLPQIRDRLLARHAPQEGVISQDMPQAILAAGTGIQAIDASIQDLYATGYMHNHARMWVASLTCNIAHTDWRTPSKWMYYHLLDGDYGSNTLSWQWVAGTFSSKRYL